MINFSNNANLKYISAISDKLTVTWKTDKILINSGAAMLRPLLENRNVDEIFVADELYCNFCVETHQTKRAGNENLVALPPCNKCTGLIYAMKSKIYFVVN